MGAYLIYGGLAAFLLILAYEYGWPPIDLFNGWLRTEKSRTIARVVGWVLTAVFLVMVGLRLWKDIPDLYRGL